MASGVEALIKEFQAYLDVETPKLRGLEFLATIPWPGPIGAEIKKAILALLDKQRTRVNAVAAGLGALQVIMTDGYPGVISATVSGTVHKGIENIIADVIKSLGGFSSDEATRFVFKAAEAVLKDAK